MTLTDFISELKSIQIRHDIIHRIDYNYLAEFFRFLGIFVCEESIAASEEKESKTQAECSTVYSVYLCIGKKDMDFSYLTTVGISAEEYRNFIWKQHGQTIYLYDIIKDSLSDEQGLERGKQIKWLCHCSEDMQKQSLYRVLSVVLEKILGEEAEQVAAWLQDLIDVYVEQKIWFHSMNLQYYPKRESRVTADAEKAFIASCDQIKKVCEKKRETETERIYGYALLWCQVKANAACDFAKGILYYPIKSLSERCIQYCRKYPEFNNARVLLGLCYEPSSSCVNEALVAFHDAVQNSQNECFLAPVYYWMGKRYEAFEDKQEEAKHCYQLANSYKSKFRTCFKLAVIARNEGDYAETVRLFQIIITKLKSRESLGFLDPLELEYLFKSYTQQSYAYHKGGKYKEAIETGKKALSIKETAIQKSRYFDEFYGDDAEKYREVLKDRLNRDTAIWLIRDSEKQLSGR